MQFYVQIARVYNGGEARPIADYCLPPERELAFYKWNPILFTGIDGITPKSEVNLSIT
jgi:hypothetical protein